MNKIFLILKREYKVQIRQKSFIIMTFITPLIFIFLIYIYKIINYSNITSNILIPVNNYIFFKKKNFFIIGGMMYLMMMFIIIYGLRVMRSVLEEKNSRIIEIIISSVNSLQLITGKILGTSLVAITQFILWIIIFFLSQILFIFLKLKTIKDKILFNPFYFIFEYIKYNNIYFLLFMFSIYFIGGYLLFSSFFSAIGSIIESENDTQQYSIIVSMILIVAFYAGILAVNNPNCNIVYFCSLIPFTLPITMIGYLYNDNVNYYYVVNSVIILILSILTMIKISSKIYKFGILNYNKKITFYKLIKNIIFNYN